MSKSTSLKEYMFTFEGGGWNTVWAKSLPTAKKLAVAEYKDSDTLNVRLNSVHKTNFEAVQTACNTFY